MAKKSFHKQSKRTIKRKHICKLYGKRLISFFQDFLQKKKTTNPSREIDKEYEQVVLKKEKKRNTSDQ